jgi:UDP-N-acetylmuramoyl-tripeptide--D-alanyl-D-alanine ligase
MLPRTILRARPWHRFVVAEVAITEPGIMWRSALLLKPDIAVLLNVKRNHVRAFGSLERIAEEKVRLLPGMSRRGLAIMNADDPQVVKVAGRLKCPIRWFGMREECDYRFSQARAKWPERLSFTVHHAGLAEPVRTQLVGRHWAGSALAAIAVGHAMGIPLEEAGKPLAELPPFPLRLSPSVLDSGAVVIRDRDRGSVDDLDAAIDVLREYAGGRRILITGDGLDLEGNYRHRWKHLARVAATACDVCVCVGEKSKYGRRKAIEAGIAERQVHAYLSPGQVEEFLARETGPGDLILWR